VRGADAQGCLSAQDLRLRVEQHLGSGSFATEARTHIEGLVEKVDEHWVARLWIQKVGSPSRPNPRVITSEASECHSLDEAIVLAALLAIDPTAALGPRLPPQETATQETATQETKAATASEAPQQNQPQKWSQALPGFVAARAVFGGGILPGFAPGAELAAGLGERWQGEAALLWFAAQKDSAGEAEYSFSGIAPAFCAAFILRPSWSARFCSRVVVGQLTASLLLGERTQPGASWLAYAELGLRGEFMLLGPLGIMLEAGAAAPLTRYRFFIEGTERTLFEQPPVWIQGRAGIALHFW